MMTVKFQCEQCKKQFEIPIQSADDPEVMALIIECVSAKCPQCGKQCKPQTQEPTE